MRTPILDDEECANLNEHHDLLSKYRITTFVSESDWNKHKSHQCASYRNKMYLTFCLCEFNNVRWHQVLSIFLYKWEMKKFLF